MVGPEQLANLAEQLAIPEASWQNLDPQPLLARMDLPAWMPIR
ncbi:MAG: hypothetical protein ACFBRM_00540 [Pikeienuella sp.]